MAQETQGVFESKKRRRDSESTYVDELRRGQDWHGTETELLLREQLLRQGLLVQQKALLLRHF